MAKLARILVITALMVSLIPTRGEQASQAQRALSVRYHDPRVMGQSTQARLSSAGAAAPTDDPPIPLPRDCDGITPPGQYPPACCAYGYVYYNDEPVAGASVRIESAQAVVTVTTASGGASDDPYYSVALGYPPISATVGSVVAFTVVYSDANASRTWTVVDEGQQVDIGLVSSLAISGSWTTKTPMVAPRNDAAAAAVDGMVYIVGGVNGSGALSSTLMYDPAADAWTSVSDMPGAKSGPGAAVVNGRIYVIGPPDRQVYEYDPAGDSWAIKSSLPITPSGAAVAAISGQVFVAFNVAGETHPRLYVYDPFDDIWQQRQSHPDERSIESLGVANGMIYAVGGCIAGQVPCEPTQVDRYDPMNDTWTTNAIPPLTTRRTHLGPTLPTVNGKMYVIGGWNGYSTLSSVEVYDPWNNTWATERPMPTARYRAACATVGNNIYAIGGDWGGSGGHWLTTNEELALSEPTRSRDSITFVSGRDGYYEIYTMDSDGSHQLRITNDGCANWHPGWTPGGTRILFSVDCRGNRDIYSMNPDGTDWRRLTIDPLWDTRPSMSPDGQEIAFLRGAQPDELHLWVMNTDGSSETQLTFGPGHEDDSALTWSPDSQYIVFRSTRSGSWQLWRINVDGSDLTQLTDLPGEAHDPAWSPNGSTIAFTSEGDLRLMDPDGSHIRLLSGPGWESRPAWSPDGTRLAYNSWRDSAEGEIYSKRTDNTDEWNLSSNLAYDSDPAWARPIGNLLLFGGFGGTETYSDTWTLNGTDWVEIESTAPIPPHRSRHSMAYDARRDRVVLFGGNLSGTNEPTDMLSDTWEYVGGSWMQVEAIDAPSPRAHADMAYDSKRGVTVLFGGYDSGWGVCAISSLTDTWEYDGTNWRQITTTTQAPPQFVLGGMVYDEAHEKIVLVSGWQCQGFDWEIETWEYDGVDWTKVTTGTLGNTWRYNSSLAYDRVRKRVVLFGGYYYGGLLDDTWEYDGQQWTQITPPHTPPARHNHKHMMAYDETRQATVLFGGEGATGYLTDTWKYDGTDWQEITTTHQPPARRFSALVPSSLGSVIAAFMATPLTGTAPLVVQFTDQSTGGVVGWEWTFSDGHRSGARYPTHTYEDAGVYTVTLTVTNPSGSDTETKAAYITVTCPPPGAGFSATPLSGQAPRPVTFTDHSSGEIDSWLWDFGDGGTSTQQNPTHIYTVSGTYPVTLTVSGPCGSDFLVRPDYIEIPSDAETKTWTFMLYLAGDNNLSPWLKRAIERMEQVPSKTNLNVLVLVDHWREGDTRLYHIQYHPGSGIGSPAISSPWVGWNGQDELNMGAPATLQHFVTWARENYPADHYFLSIANHGRGTSGIAWDKDDVSNGDYLTSYGELGTVLSNATGGGADKIDVLMFDACLMALLEVDYEIKDMVDYVIASQNMGWSVFAYDSYMQLVEDSTAPATLAVDVAHGYFTARQDTPKTIRAVDASKLITLTSAVDAFAQALSDAVNNGGASRMIGVRRATQVFDSYLPYDGPDPDSDEYIDLYHFAVLVKANFSEKLTLTVAAQGVMDAVNAAIIYENSMSAKDIWSDDYWNLDNAHGIAIYFPPRSGGGDYQRYLDEVEWAFTVSTQWDEFLLDYFTITHLVEENWEDSGPGAMGDPTNYVFLPLVMRGL